MCECDCKACAKNLVAKKVKDLLFEMDTTDKFGFPSTDSDKRNARILKEAILLILEQL